jgi:hypothetical protein
VAAEKCRSIESCGKNQTIHAVLIGITKSQDAIRETRINVGLVQQAARQETATLGRRGATRGMAQEAARAGLLETSLLQVISPIAETSHSEIGHPETNPSVAEMEAAATLAPPATMIVRSVYLTGATRAQHAVTTGLHAALIGIPHHAMTVRPAVINLGAISQEMNGQEINGHEMSDREIADHGETSLLQAAPVTGLKAAPVEIARTEVVPVVDSSQVAELAVNRVVANLVVASRAVFGGIVKPCALWADG